MRGFALLPVLVLLTAGCGWQNVLLGFGSASGPFPPAPKVVHACVVITVDGRSHPCRSESLSNEIIQDVPSWVTKENLPANAGPGAKLFAVAGCTACHMYAGSGASNLGAPDLTAIGKRHLGIAFEIRHLRCPSCINPGSPMPPFASLGRKRLREVAIFLEASKGTH